jgi:acetoin utilization protein AcuB
LDARVRALTAAAHGESQENVPELSPRAVGRFMTTSPHSIGRDQSLETAHTMMRTHAIRHLPVLEAGKLAGIVSQRDLYFVESLAPIDPRTVKVEDAMSQETYSVRPDTPVDEVAREMADRRYGCAVVIENNKVVGVFTTTDALRALSELLDRRRGSLQ